MQTKRQIQELLTAAGVSPNRRLGQHFLVDLNLLRLLVDSADPGPRDVALEVGCGTGSLTEALAERAGAVVAVEIDPTLAAIAKQRLAMPPRDTSSMGVPPMSSSTGILPVNSSTGVPPVDTPEIHGRDARATNRVQIINDDVLASKGALNPLVVEALERARRSSTGVSPVETDDRQGQDGPATHGQSAALAQAGDAHATMGRLLLVSNLPYDVASPVIADLVKGPPVADAMFVTVQKEVAERMTAGPGGRDYGTLSIFLQATGHVEILRVLKPSVFWPPPGVDSAMVRYIRDESKCRRIKDFETLSEVVALFMGHRRKMLRACIKSVPPNLGNPDLWRRLLERQSIDPMSRPGDLTPAQYVDLANACRHAA